jgi:cytolethal distending toxin subunit B
MAQIKLGTWNMQGGADATKDSKWTNGVAALMKNVDVLCLQETGTGVPSTAAGRDGLRVSQYTWSGYYIMFHQWMKPGGSPGVAANRCNLAIVSTSPPSNHCIINSQSLIWRPVLCCLINNVWISSIHAISPGGPDAPALISSVFTRATTACLIAGDFNRDPATLPGPPNIISSGCDTHPSYKSTSSASPRELDYCISNIVPRSKSASRQDCFDSDHYAVTFDINL